MDEMKRIIDQTVITEAKTTWKYYVPRIIKQAQMEKGVHIEKKIQEIGINDDDCKIHILHSNTHTIPYLLELCHIFKIVLQCIIIRVQITLFALLILIVAHPRIIPHVIFKARDSYILLMISYFYKSSFVSLHVLS